MASGARPSGERPPANRLASETSPYLRQHADNPVDWYPWGAEAFERAAADDKPLLISIGYSSCHWCHVMAHESFEDPATAAVMNELFVNVKVDREERPDVDAVYMEATQAMTGSGGWPMTVFATPDGRPFFCGTYFPPTGAPGRPGFVDLCRAVDQAWHGERDDLVAQADRITQHLQAAAVRSDRAIPGAEAITAAIAKLCDQHDDRRGGFGRAPKFPQASNLDLLLAAGAHGDARALAAARITLDAMAAGGIYDHIGGGFARYSVDDVWLAPHFEKMLYDQAQLVRVYLHAWQLTSDATYLQVVEETVGYVLRDLRHPSGGFFSAEDADSEGVEGKFYLWAPAEVRRALEGAGEPHLAGPALEWWGITEAGNFEGSNIANRIAHRGELTRPDDVEAARRILFEARTERVRPGLDDKVLTEWNALMFGALAEAGAATGNAAWVDAAAANAEFLCAELRDPVGRWLRSWQADAGEAKQPAFAADHGALVEAFVHLYEATGQVRWLDEARHCADTLLDRFWDLDAGGVFTTADDAEKLVARPKDLMDNASPSANSLVAVGFVRLTTITGDQRYREAADAIFELLGTVAVDVPGAFGHLLHGLDLAVHEPLEIVVSGERDDLVAQAQRRWLPHAVLVWGEPFDGPLWEGRTAADGEPETGRAFVCRGMVCDAPTADAAALGAQLDAVQTAGA
ncbi:MAG TPA: thioredoxin domain-containing protein [Acidimicrobiales bacterium]|jgi:uncharacterized protein YyaL (SSP411 family)|nr:thioredoxin domain-containing protein [Acidimicrobiales bacterium]